MDDDVDTATSRQLSSAQRVDAWTVHAGMAQGGRDPDIPYIPDCIESEDEVSAVFNLHDMRQGLPGSHLGRPERQRRRHRAGRQACESRERHKREREE